MESTLNASTSTTLALLTVTKALNRRLCKIFPSHQPLASRLIARRLTCNYGGFHRQRPFSSSTPRRSLCVVDPPTRRRLECVASNHASFASGGGNGGFGGESGGSGGDGGGSSDGGDSKSKVVASGGDDVSAVSTDVILLDVGGMTCGGCAASVKRILESQPQVSSASVNLTTEVAIIWPVSEAKLSPNWQKQLGETLANHLTNCGFNSNIRACRVKWQVRELHKEIYHHRTAKHFLSGSTIILYDSGRNSFLKMFERKIEDKRKRLKESGHELAFSWALCAVCLVGHLSHFLGAEASWIHAFHSTGFHLSLSLFTLLGPGRRLILDGLKSLVKGAPNMNTLVGLGALSSFTVSSLAAFIPKLGWKTFFEEPIMLIAFVLLGRNLEQRAKIKASSDMTELLNILPAKARLLVNDGVKESETIVEVPSNSLCVGDQVVVLPGDRVPVDGIVIAGRSTIDESSFTGEPLPVTKLPGSQVAAGSINLNGSLTIVVQRPGGETAMADIVRLVEEAQSREAPVQRLADKVSGHFTYGVMGLSAATFLFWSLIGGRILPAVLQGGNSVSLALQLSCSVLVVACPCALGLATPTAVLVGTSLGATRGLLLRGGNVLEKFSMVNTVVFDKTGTLTMGKPVVTKILTPKHAEVTDVEEKSNHTWSDLEVLKFAAGVESNTIHPVGKAIVEAARAVNCQIIQVADGTFIEEPGSGAVAIIEDKRVSVGTLDWVQRHGVNENPFEEVEAHKSQSVVQGISVYMLSGDKTENAEYVASVVGIPKEKVISGVKPREKKKFITELQNDQNIVAMVGDGINDAAALASSHVGIAMGGGVGAASEASSIVLLGNRLSQLVDALELSRLTMETVKQNLWWAFAYNIVGLPIAAGVLLPVTGTMLTPSIAGALMGLSSVGVMANSLFLRYKFSLKQERRYKRSAGTKTNRVSNIIMDKRVGEKHPNSDERWKGA
ncbi:copper-transporting ATPase PAA1, chloroplastic isoform X3 [Rosa chinensis]|uniref:copper-transporting ATPase PAA1, chloroplastic isoform X3 n=1 Tax=Rosa chinensis TaxID=74649 RepID=UPI001AD8F09C|nr:copper-transporting ATPase PAA1, chloroplastic isoform X3 [Rosa chinensis]